MRILIAGGTGYVGAHVAEDLARRGHEVTCLARAPGLGTSSAERME